MSKVDTDQGLGPGSERLRRELAGIKEEKRAVDKNAETQPGVGKVQKRTDTVDDLLDGFGSSRPDIPRILPNADTTPPPEPVKKELTPTEPGKRQRTRNMILAAAVTFAVIAAIGIAFVKMGSSSSSVAQPTPNATTATTNATSTATVATATATSTETTPLIATTSVEALPTVKTAATTSGRPVHSATTSTAAVATSTATTTATPHPTGSGPPGMNLLPDDPHR